MHLRSGKTINPKKKPQPSFANLPKNFMINLMKKLPRKNATMMYIASPRNVRYALKPNMNKYKKIENLRRKINFRGNVNSRTVNPNYIRVVRRLQQLNNTPNNNYVMRGKTSTGYHIRRVQEMQNLLGRLRRNGNQYVNDRNGRRYNYNRGSLVSVPTHPSGVYVTIARGLKHKPNGRLYFNI